MIVVLPSCGIYSFTGASIPPDAKTAAVLYIPNQAELIAPTLSPTLTEKLRDKILGETNLDLMEEEGDFVFEGYITKYIVGVAASSGAEVAELNRLTIEVNITFTNNLDSEKGWTRRFERFSDFDKNLNLSAVEADLIEELTEQFVAEIFNGAFADW